jgi:cholest-4-en-3-one 26-monooxygenase
VFSGSVYIVGDLETTRNTISAGLLVLIEHPHNRRELTHNAQLMPTAIEEILRWASRLRT